MEFSLLYSCCTYFDYGFLQYRGSLPIFSEILPFFCILGRLSDLVFYLLWWWCFVMRIVFLVQLLIIDTVLHQPVILLNQAGRWPMRGLLRQMDARESFWRHRPKQLEWLESLLNDFLLDNDVEKLATLNGKARYTFAK
ncbi:hypothetical protein RvY_10419 [Ramazzottius varieornatus]|uniref:Uncharacterized protein n=1 Tax=Ramazzottius varieornatus TaxID=947166 RepID=A0A1D1VCQ4_RAMVA|nr:hypothetical protein RvY_10419 [Ramazzottius varieornatus]